MQISAVASILAPPPLFPFLRTDGWTDQNLCRSSNKPQKKVTNQQGHVESISNSHIHGF